MLFLEQGVKIGRCIRKKFGRDLRDLQIRADQHGLCGGHALFCYKIGKADAILLLDDAADLLRTQVDMTGHIGQRELSAVVGIDIVLDGADMGLRFGRRGDRLVFRQERGKDGVEYQRGQMLRIALGGLCVKAASVRI